MKTATLIKTTLLAVFFGLILTSCEPYSRDADGAQAFLDQVTEDFKTVGNESAHAAWVAANFISYDTQKLRALASERVQNLAVRYAQEATRFDGLDLPADTRRQLDLLKQGLTLPPPLDPAKSKELAEIESNLDAMYGSGTYCSTKDGKKRCRQLGELSKTIASSRNYDELLDVWQGWRSISPPMRPLYERLVEIGNEGANELGYKDLGSLWRSGYDMDADEFVTETDRLWGQVKPLYESLHCLVRAKLAEEYGEDKVPLNEPIPAHLLGNMWAQQWGYVYDLVKPASTGSAGYDLTEIIKQKDMDELEMVRIAEGFFTSLGLEPLPETFWERSLFTKPRDRDVVCHASAWNLDSQDDIRIKMCIERNEEDFVTIHHELGHNFYQRAYKDQPLMFQGGANDGFHEAIGDTIALSITPDYLVKIGLLDKAPRNRDDIALLLRQALDKIAFLPFGLMVDQWRWKVFSGELGRDEWNRGWWDLRLKYQGIRPPVARSESNFDPGAKYHIPGNTPYMRYFLAHIQQYQFHRALCKTAGYTGPLHLCTIYGNKDAGKRLNQVLEMGMSKPWPDAMQVLAGQSQMDASAILNYFAPLQTWLDEQNKGRSCGW